MAVMSKKELHPKDYRAVVFSDEAAGFSILTKSTAKSDETIKWEDGNEYPLVKVQISSASHPFFTGEEKIIDTEGRVDRFKAHAERAAKLRDSLGNKAKKLAKEAEKKAKKEEAIEK
jgi:large subunit ribosomal protein L31